MTRTHSALQTLFICVVAAVVTEYQGLADEPADPTVSALLDAHNFIRQRNKLAPLALSPALCKSAEIHARDMANHEKMTHTGSDGSNPSQRARRVGYRSSWVGENVAVSQWTVEQVMTEWMNSRGHRGNILGKYTEMGAARVQDELGNFFWCVNFGDPRPAIHKMVRKPEAVRATTAKRVNTEAAAALIKHINLEREASKQVLLKADAALGRAAMSWSAAMADKESLDIDGDPLMSVDKKALPRWEIHLEVGANIPTPQEAARQFVSEGGQDLADFRAIGVGYALAKSGTPYWCAIFAKPVGPDRPD
jgi:uncharacterized protein YkwD